jgi:hypothetical protein
MSIWTLVCCGYAAPSPGIDGALVVTEPKTAKSRR